MKVPLSHGIVRYWSGVLYPDHMNTEVEVWLSQNVGKQYAVSSIGDLPPYEIFFQDPNDAMMFKLRWYG